MNASSEKDYCLAILKELTPKKVKTPWRRNANHIFPLMYVMANKCPFDAEVKRETRRLVVESGLPAHKFDAKWAEALKYASKKYMFEETIRRLAFPMDLGSLLD